MPSRSEMSESRSHSRRFRKSSVGPTCLVTSGMTQEKDPLSRPRGIFSLQPLTLCLDSEGRGFSACPWEAENEPGIQTLQSMPAVHGMKSSEAI